MLSTNIHTNRFKKGNKDVKNSSDPNEEVKTEGDNGKGVGLIDAWKKPVDKPAMEFNPKNPKKNKASKKAAEKEKAEKKTASKTKVAISLVMWTFCYFILMFIPNNSKSKY